MPFFGRPVVFVTPPPANDACAQDSRLLEMADPCSKRCRYALLGIGGVAFIIAVFPRNVRARAGFRDSRNGGR